MRTPSPGGATLGGALAAMCVAPPGLGRERIGIPRAHARGYEVPPLTGLGSTRYLWKPDQVEAACCYVREGQGVDLAEGV